MKSPLDPDIFDDLFHACALAAFLEEARLTQAWPDREHTRRRAYLLYEQELARQPRNYRIDETPSGPLPCDANQEKSHA